MSINLEELVNSEAVYNLQVQTVIEEVKGSKDMEATLKKVVLFCKYGLSVNQPPSKKYLCLCLICDVSQKITHPSFENFLDENIPSKLLKSLSLELKEDPHNIKDKYSQQFTTLAAETIHFWATKFSHLPQQSHFGNALTALAQMGWVLPSSGYLRYIKSRLATEIWTKWQSIELKGQLIPLFQQIYDRFEKCKAEMETSISEALFAGVDVSTREMLGQLRDFLMFFFLNYRSIEEENSVDKHVLVVYFHILNEIFKQTRKSTEVSPKNLMRIVKQCFEATYSSEMASINRMEITNLVELQHFDTLDILQRIKAKVENQQAKIGEFHLQKLKTSDETFKMFGNIRQKSKQKKLNRAEKEQRKIKSFKNQ